ncbi:MAG: o-succinylbenzoate synthase [Cytophagaceae bacterium]|nr:o-succinylbenzoate synthase [Cytophagaceae bacterium]
MKAIYYKHLLYFKRPSGTSRGILKTKETWFLQIESNGKKGIGECGLLRGLSIDDRPDYEARLQWTCDHIDLGVDELWDALKEFPSIQFGVEMAFASLASTDPFELYPSAFTRGQAQIPINGLVWMGDQDFMAQQIKEKLEAGFNCIKMKIGAIATAKELALLAGIREQCAAAQMTLRVDANGAFSPAQALKILEALANLEIHSIEQPIGVRQWDAMKRLCSETPTPIALDEELIGIFDKTQKRELLARVRPQYIILKPSFIGGFKGSTEWITIADELGIGWWVTSALESNIGLNAITQWTYTLDVSMPQGLGTGSLYTNNFKSPLHIAQGKIGYDTNKEWQFNFK